MSDYRIVVTGSRHWAEGPAANLIRNKLALAVDAATTIGMSAHMTAECVTEAEIVIVHGGAPGADSIAGAWAEKRGLRVEVFEALWHTEGNSAGPKRNRRMLDAGAKFVLAFPDGGRGDSPGTWDCIEAAAERGISIAIHPRKP